METPISNNSYEKLINDYVLKQKRFKYLVKQIQMTINACEYKKYGYSLSEYVKRKWNISQPQTYRYLIAAKVMDQLSEFEFQPNYVNLCKSIYNYAKTPSQIKLLWKTLLLKSRGKPYYINSSHVSKTWKELSHDKKYSHICHYEDAVMKNIENSKKSNEKDNTATKNSNIDNHSSIQITPSSPTSYDAFPTESDTFVSPSSLPFLPSPPTTINTLSKSDLFIPSNSIVPSSSEITIPSSTTSIVPSSTEITIPSSTTSIVPSSSEITIPSSTTSIIPSSTELTIPSSAISYLPSVSASFIPSSSETSITSPSISVMPSFIESNISSSSASTSYIAISQPFSENQQAFINGQLCYIMPITNLIPAMYTF